VGGGSSTIIVNVNLLANLSSRTQFSLCSEVCSVNISRPETDVADWSVHDPEETSARVFCCDAVNSSGSRIVVKAKIVFGRQPR
jgi:hypothetical protein